jgi:ABC-type nickel/cobalt efflux system permease component RcnA
MLRRTAAALVATFGLVLLFSGTASAHPLGNFTSNHYDEVVLSGDRAYVLSVLDLAEIPTFQAKARVDTVGRARYGTELGAAVAKGLELRVDGERRHLTAVDRRLTFPKGAAGLRTTRLELVFDAGPVVTGPHAVALENTMLRGRLGWREIVVRAERGARLTRSSVPSSSISDRLRTYPRNRLSSPLHVTSATAGFTPGSTPGLTPTFGVTSASAAPTGGTGFAALIEQQELTLGVVLVSLAIAFFWGAAHALTPGHGKAVVTAYLVGTRGRAKDALALGGIVTVTHTIGVFALGFVTLGLSELIVPEDLYPWLNLVSAVLVVLVGVAVFRRRILAALASSGDPHHGHHHHHRGHDHTHGGHHHHHHHESMTDEEHARAHLPPEGTGLRGLLAVGISGGLLPCPTALVVLLAAISLHRVAYGLVLIVAFSVGLAAVVSGIGLLAVGARQTFRRVSFDGPVVRALPTVSALVILVVGVAMTARAVPGVL